MAKVFSVEWMSQSIHRTDAQTGADSAKEDKRTFLQLPLPFAFQTNTTFPKLDISDEPKISLSAGNGSDIKEASKTYSPSSPTNSSGYTSGSESEVGEDGDGGIGPHRRLRTKFTSDQLYRLEKLFNKNRYLGAKQRRNTAEKLELSETQVKTWFQNRRMKLKREVQDQRAEYFCPSISSMLFSAHDPLSQYSYAAQYGHFSPGSPALYGQLVHQVISPQMYPLMHPRLYY